MHDCEENKKKREDRRAEKDWKQEEIIESKGGIRGRRRKKEGKQ